MKHAQLKLKKTEYADLAMLFQFQLDEEARYLAAFTAQDSTDRAAYFRKFTRILSDPTINTQTIYLNEGIVGSIAKFVLEGEAEITYWLDKRCWGKGIAAAALEMFLAMEPARPLTGRVAFDNLGSQKVLEKCGFSRVGADKGFANARQAEIEEFIYKLT